MKLTICDRCGNTCRPITYCGEALYLGESHKERAIREATVEGIDLCHDCMGELRDFLRGREFADNGNSKEM